MVGPIILTQLFGTGETVVEEQEMAQELNDSDHSSVNSMKARILTPIEGTIIPLDQVPDEVFSTGMMGAGIAIEPSTNEIYAPFSGTVTSIFDSKHAIGLTSEEDVEVLIHVGIDTVNLKGEGFEYFVKQEQQVEQGQLLLRFDQEKIKKAGYLVTTMIVITNSGQLNEVLLTKKETVTHADTLIDCQ